MPFVSEAQRRWMHATHPNMAKKWERHTPKGIKLPKHVRGSAHGSGQFVAANIGAGYKLVRY